MTTVNPNMPIPPALPAQVYRHPSQTVQPTNPAGGEVLVGQYTGKTPGLEPKKV
jgi:hypothetical protein